MTASKALNRNPGKCSGPIPDFSSADNQKKRASYFYGRNSTKLILRRPAAVADHGGRCCQGLMGSRGCHGSTIDLCRWHMVEEGVLNDGPLLNGWKRPGTYRFPRSFAAAAAAAIASSSTAVVDGNAMAFNRRQRRP